MKSIKGTQTEKNLMAAFAGESEARNRYTYYASAARKEGYEQIAAIFEETANQEKEHAKREFSFLQGGEVQITATFPGAPVGTTLENLKQAAAGELYETTKMYPEFMEAAQREGFPEIAAVFKHIGRVELRHKERYEALIRNVENGEVFKKSKPVRWACRNCGYIHEGPEAPNACPACAHPQAYYEVEATNF